MAPFFPMLTLTMEVLSENIHGIQNAINADKPVYLKMSLYNHLDHPISIWAHEDPFDGSALFTNKVFSRQDVSIGEIVQLGNNVTDDIYEQPKRDSFREVGGYATLEKEIILTYDSPGVEESKEWFEPMLVGHEYIYKAGGSYTVFNGPLADLSADEAPPTDEIYYQCKSQKVHAVQEVTKQLVPRSSSQESASRFKSQSGHPLKPIVARNSISETGSGLDFASKLGLIMEIIVPSSGLLINPVKSDQDIWLNVTVFNSADYPLSILKIDTILDDLVYLGDDIISRYDITTGLTTKALSSNRPDHGMPYEPEDYLQLAAHEKFTRQIRVLADLNANQLMTQGHDYIFQLATQWDIFNGTIHTGSMEYLNWVMDNSHRLKYTSESGKIRAI